LSVLSRNPMIYQKKLESKFKFLNRFSKHIKFKNSIKMIINL
jgi:hypothetical protein